MLHKKIRIEITPSGEIRAKTLGMTGEECLDYVEVIEQLLDAKSVDSEFTEEFLEHRIKQQVKETQQIKRE